MKAKEKVIKSIVKALFGKKVLFLENGSTSLEECSSEFQKLLNQNNIESKILDVDEIDFSIIVKEIKRCDAIVYETQWVYDISKKILDYMLLSNDKKTVVECYIYEPTWKRKPNTIHDVYLFTCDPISIEFGGGTPYEFYKLKK